MMVGFLPTWFRLDEAWTLLEERGYPRSQAESEIVRAIAESRLSTEEFFRLPERPKKNPRSGDSWAANPVLDFQCSTIIFPVATRRRIPVYRPVRIEIRRERLDEYWPAERSSGTGKPGRRGRYPEDEALVSEALQSIVDGLAANASQAANRVVDRADGQSREANHVRLQRAIRRRQKEHGES